MNTHINLRRFTLISAATPKLPIFITAFSARTIHIDSFTGKYNQTFIITSRSCLDTDTRDPHLA